MGRFVKQIMNWVDLLAILPYYVGLLITMYKDQVLGKIIEWLDCYVHCHKTLYHIKVSICEVLNNLI